MRHVTTRHEVLGDPVGVIDAIWSGAEWNARWKEIICFNVRYDDGIHQIAEITFNWDGVETRMEVVRFRVEPCCIDFFCPRPPSPLAHQSGQWAVESKDGKNILVASRRIDLAPDPGRCEGEAEVCLDRYADRLSQRLSLILPRFARPLE